MNIFVCDIDGTVCDSMKRAEMVNEKYGIEDSNNWEEVHIKEFMDPEKTKLDVVIPGSERIISLSERYNAKLFFLTGRSDFAREQTAKWLTENLKVDANVPLIMRPKEFNGNAAVRKEQMFKESILDFYPEASFVFFDDDESLLPRYAKYGLALKAPECWKVIK